MSEVVTVDGVTVVAERPPGVSGAPVVFVHGLAAGAWVFEPYQRLFAERDHPSYSVNLRGRYGSRLVANIGRVSLLDYVHDASDVVRWVAATHGAMPVLVGHSMGGLVAQKVAEAGLARALVLLCSAPPRGISVASPALVARQLRYAHRLLLSRPVEGRPADHGALTFNRIPPAERAALYARMVADSGRAGREMSLGLMAVDHARVRCPVLSVSGAEDRFVAPRVGRRIAAKYRAPYWLYPDHAHFLMFEPGWKDVATDVLAWIGRVCAPSGAERGSGGAGARPMSQAR